MTTRTRELAPVDAIRKKLVNTPVHTTGKRPSPVGLSDIVAAHGTSIEAVFDLARQGEFKGGTDPEGRFFAVPNLNSKDWRIPDHTKNIYEIKARYGIINPLTVAEQYAEAAASESEDNPHGVVILFGKKIVDLVEDIQVGGIDEPEPEVLLTQAPPIRSIRRIYALDQFALEALNLGLQTIKLQNK